MIQALKERIASLSVEAYRIRVRETQHKRRVRENVILGRLIAAGYSPVQIRRLMGYARRPRATVPEVAVRIAEHKKNFNGMVRYRKHTLRKEARAHLLAYNFLRDKEYIAAEKSGSYEKPDWSEIERIAQKFSDQTEQVLKQRFARWLHQAGLDYHNLAGRG